MDWLEILKITISYMEQHLLDSMAAEEIANLVHVSPFYYQKGFKLMTGYSIGEYIRNRRLYLAALEILQGNEKIIDLAFRYGYETPESFTRAFSRFHGVSPMQLKQKPHKIQPFLPLSVQISVIGGNQMNYSIESMPSFRIIGRKKEYEYSDAFEQIPKFWDELIHSKFVAKYEQELDGCCFGCYGVSIERKGDWDRFDYMIAGNYHEGPIPEGFEVITVPAITWAKFHCIGPMPAAIQSMNVRIYKEWLPQHPEYEIADVYFMEYYTLGDSKGDQYYSEIWIPVRNKLNQ